MDVTICIINFYYTGLNPVIVSIGILGGVAILLISKKRIFNLVFLLTLFLTLQALTFLAIGQSPCNLNI